MAEIIVKEEIISKDPIIISEVVTLPGIKGDKGDPFTYDDFTPEQIAELQRPATEAAAVANAAANRAETAAESVQGAVEDAEQASQRAQQAATEAQEAVKNAKAVIDKAETAINNANTAAETANTAVESVNALEVKVEQAEEARVQSESQRQTAETNRALAEQLRETNETERQKKFAQIESNATSLENSLNEAEAQRVSAENLREEAEAQRETTEQNRATEFSKIKTEVGTLVTQTTEAKNAANTAATSATNAASAANTAAGLANEAATAANNAAQKVDGRVTALEGKASQVYENLAAIESSGETNVNKIYIDGETMQPYIYKGGKFVPFKGGNVVQDPNNIPFYTCRYDDEFAVPINEADLTDVIVFRKRYGTNVERIKNGKSVWKKAVADIYLNHIQNYKLNQTLFVVEGYLYFRSKPYGVYKFSLEDGTFINNRTDIYRCEAICYLNGNIYAVGDTNKLVVLNKDDLSLVSSTELDANLKVPYLNSYEDRCIVLLDTKAVVVKQDEETQEFTFDAQPRCGFYIPRTTYVNAPFYVFFANGQIHTISEDLQYNFKSNINNGAIDDSLIGKISDLTQYITEGNWQSICFIGERGCYICKIPGNNPITSILFTALNINSNINKDGTIGWYDCFYKTKSDKYIIKKGGLMYKMYSLI